MKKNTRNCHSVNLPTRHVLFAASALCLSLSACSSDDGDKVPEATIADDSVPGVLVGGLNGMAASEITSPWLVIVETFRRDSQTPGSGDAYVAIVPYSQDKLMSEHVEFFAKDLDTCKIQDLSAPTDGDNNGNIRVSGGESVSIDSPEGTWYTLEKIGDDDIYYETDNGLPGELPVDATLSIPGDVFPGPVAYPLNEPDVPVRILPAENEQLTIDTQYSWIPSSVSSSVRLDFLAYDSNEEFLGFAIGCDVVDDGSFELPEDALAYIAASEDQLTLRYSRSLRRVDLIDDVVVYQAIEVAE